MNTLALHGFAASPIAFISHEHKQVVIQFLSVPTFISILLGHVMHIWLKIVFYI